MVEHITSFTSSGTMNYTFNSGLVWINFFFVAGFCFLTDFCILIYKHFFRKNIFNMVKSLKNKDDISLKYIKTLPIELQNLLLIDDRVKEFNLLKEDIKEENNSKNEINDNNYENENINGKIKKNNKIRFNENEINENNINKNINLKRSGTMFTNNHKKNHLPLEENKENNSKRVQKLNKTFIITKKKIKKKIKIKKSNNNLDVPSYRNDNHISMKNLNINTNNKLNINNMKNIIDEDFKEMTNIMIPKNNSKKPFGNIKFENSKNNLENKLEINEQTKLKGTNRKLLE